MRKNRIGLIISLGLLFAIALSACGSKTSDTAAPAASTAPAASAAPSEMTALIEAAKKEGKVVYNGPSSPEARQALTDAFQKAYGITLEVFYLGSGDMLARADREFKAGQVSVDVSTGVSNSYIMSTRGQVQDMAGVIVDPTVKDPKAWKEGYPIYYNGNKDLAKEFVVGVQYSVTAQPQLFVNPDIIKDGQINTWQDLLKPEFSGKIAAHDPRQGGAGQGTAISIIYGMGEEFFKSLYLNQKITLSKDTNQLAEWVARGTYPIAIGLSASNVIEFQKNSLPIKRIFPADGPDALTAGGGGMFMLKNSPHPNAAKLLINWLLSKEAQEILESYQFEPSMRVDTTKGDMIPDWIKKNETRTYKLHDGLPDFYFNNRKQIVEKIQSILGR